MSNYQFSIIVPVYNVEAYLEKCVASLLNQEQMQDRIEILLIDDGSKDQSGELCDRLAEKFPQVKVYHKENGGLSSARNLGIEKASGEYILFIDSDDYIEKNSCLILSEALRRNGQADAVIFDGAEDDGIHKKSMRRIPIERERCADGRTHLLEHYKTRNMNVEACLYAYRREFLLENGLRFREGILHEDVEFTPRAVLKCRKIVEIPDCLYYYMVRENSISTQKNRKKNIHDLFQTLAELEVLAEQQDRELCRWMKNGILNSYLNMVQDARMYKREYRKMLDKKFLLGKAATNWNRFRVVICLINVRLYCWMNDCHKKIRGAKCRGK